MRSRNPRGTLTRERIVVAAVDIADTQGADALQMRHLAASLSAATMAIYNHVDSKESLFDLMVEHIVREIERPPADADWRSGLRDLATSTRDTLTRHPWAIDIWSSRLPGPERWALMETVLEMLSQAGLPPDLADLAFHAIVNHILGYTRMDLASDALKSDTIVVAGTDLVGLDPQRFPRIREHLGYHATPHPDHDPFLYVLEVIIHDLGLRGLGLRGSVTPRKGEPPRHV